MSMAAAIGGWTGIDRWITSGDNSAISEQIVRLTNKAKNSAFGEAVVASGRAEWDLTIEMESFGGISIGIFRQDLKDRDNINALPTDEFFINSPDGYGYANKSGKFATNNERTPYGTRYRHGDKITVRLDLTSRTLHYLVNDEDQGCAVENLPKGAYRLACCMQFKEQRVVIKRHWTSLGKEGTVPKVESTKTLTAEQDKIGKEHEVDPAADPHDPPPDGMNGKDTQQRERELFTEYKEPMIDPDAPLFGDDYGVEHNPKDDGGGSGGSASSAASSGGSDDSEDDDDVYVPAESEDDDDDPMGSMQSGSQIMESKRNEEEEYQAVFNEPDFEAMSMSGSASMSLEVDPVGLIGGRARGLSMGTDHHMPEPLTIETVDDDATDFFSVSGSNLKADRCSVTCTRESGVVHSAFGTQLVARGRIEWMIQIDGGHSIRIGVCGSTTKGDQLFTDTAYGYGYGDDGNIYSGGSSVEHNDGFKAGDIIGVYLNMDMNSLKFSVNGENHGDAFGSIELHPKEGVVGYRLAVSLKHRPHKLTLLESTVFNVERRSPRPTSGAAAPSFNAVNGGGHQRRLTYNLSKHQVNRAAATPTTPLSNGRTPKAKATPNIKPLTADDSAIDSQSVLAPPKKKGKKKKGASKSGDKSSSKSAAKSGAKSKKKKESNLRVKKDKKGGHKKSLSKGSTGSSSEMKKSKKKKKKKGPVDGDGEKKKKKKKRKEVSGSMGGDEESKEEEVAKKKKVKKHKKEVHWVKREGVKDRWEASGPKLMAEKNVVSTKSNIKDGNSSFGHIVVRQKMKARWELSVKHGDNIGIGICNVNGELKTTKNKKLLTQSFTNDIGGYGYMGNDGGVQRSGRYKKYGEQFKAGDKVTVELDTNSKTLSFALNGVDQGVAFKNLPSGDYRLAASFFERTQKVVLLKTTVWDVAK